MSNCNIQNLCWWQAFWFNTSTPEKGDLFIIPWSLRTALVWFCCGIHIRLRLLSCSAMSVSILCLASLLQTHQPGCHLAGNLLSWSVSSIKMLLLSRGPGRETNSQGSNSPFKTIALFRKVICPQAAASFYT